MQLGAADPGAVQQLEHGEVAHALESAFGGSDVGNVERRIDVIA